MSYSERLRLRGGLITAWEYCREGKMLDIKREKHNKKEYLEAQIRLIQIGRQ